MLLGDWTVPSDGRAIESTSESAAGGRLPLSSEHLGLSLKVVLSHCVHQPQEWAALLACPCCPQAAPWSVRAPGSECFLMGQVWACPSRHLAHSGAYLSEIHWGLSCGPCADAEPNTLAWGLRWGACGVSLLLGLGGRGGGGVCLWCEHMCV